MKTLKEEVRSAITGMEFHEDEYGFDVEYNGLNYYLFFIDKYPDLLNVGMPMLLPEDVHVTESIVQSAEMIANGNGFPEMNVSLHDGTLGVAMAFSCEIFEQSLSKEKVIECLKIFDSGYQFLMLNISVLV